MSDKLNHSDLSALLAKETRISGAKAETFTKAMFELVIEGLEQDGIVKINGLGTFKVTDVADRSSVNVNTGEKIEIKGHRKITFVPADTLKEAVNQPFAMFEPVEVDEDYQDEEYADSSVADTVEEQPAAVENVNAYVAEGIEEEMPAEENIVEETVPVVDILPEEYAPVSSDVPEPRVANVTGVEEELAATAEEEIPADVEPEIEPVIADKENETPEAVADGAVEESVEDVTEVVTTVDVAAGKSCEETANEQEVVAEEASGRENIADKDVNPKTKERFEYDEFEDEPGWLGRNWMKLLLFILPVAAVAVYFFFFDKKKELHDYEEIPQVYVQKNTPAEDNSTPLVPLQESTPVEDNVAGDNSTPLVPLQEAMSVDGGNVSIVAELAARSDKSITAADTTLYRCIGKMAIHKVSANDRLAKIANDYYGSRKLWPYIAKYNNLQKPYGLSVGMELVIPELQPK